MEEEKDRQGRGLAVFSGLCVVPCFETNALSKSHCVLMSLWKNMGMHLACMSQAWLFPPPHGTCTLLGHSGGACVNTDTPCPTTPARRGRQAWQPHPPSVSLSGRKRERDLDRKEEPLPTPPRSSNNRLAGSCPHPPSQETNSQACPLCSGLCLAHHGGSSTQMMVSQGKQGAVTTMSSHTLHRRRREENMHHWQGGRGLTSSLYYSHQHTYAPPYRQ